MFFNQDRDQLRQYFLDTWQKAEAGEPLEPLQTIIVSIIEKHPEYHAFLRQGESALGRDFLPEMGESNPFLHLGMHIAIHEQLSTNRPDGIRQIHQELSTKMGDEHDAEHTMMECLGEMIWAAQRENRLPDEQAYLNSLRELIQKK